MIDRRRAPRDAEEAAAFKGMGRAIATTRKERGMDRDELAARGEMTPAELEEIERGEFDEGWGGLRLAAKALDMPLSALFMEAEVQAPGPAGVEWRRAGGG